MTVREVLTAMWRRWYVSVAVILLAALLFALFARDGGGYTTRTLVTFLRPYATSLTPSNGANDVSVIAFAGSVAAEVNNGREPATYSETGAPYYGAGVREGVVVALPSEGNQWYDSYTRAEIEVQIVGRTYEWVEAKQAEVIANILRASASQQELLGTPSDMYITSSVVPMTNTITRVSPTRSAQAAALAAMAAAALIAGAWGAVALERASSRRKRRSTTMTSPRSPRPRQEGVFT